MGRSIRLPLTRVSDTILKQFESLLEEGVALNSYSGVRMLLQKEALIDTFDSKINENRYRPKCSMPLIHAITEGKFALVSLFLKYHYEIPQPHVINCHCDHCKADRLGQMKVQLLTLKALGNPVWLSLTAEDPFITLFKLNRLEHNFKLQNDSFQIEYKAMSMENEQTCVELLDEVKSQEEGQTLMRYKSILEENTSTKNLSFINCAIDYHQKKVVAHSVCQHFLTSAVFDDIPRWHSSWIAYKIFITAFLAVLYPITSMINILCPAKFSISKIAMKPFVKFVNGAASFVTFLVLLMVLGATDRNGIRIGNSPTGLEIIVLIWIIGFCFGEFKQVYKRGLTDYLSSGWNWVDIGMDTLMLFSFITWFVLSFHKPENIVVYEAVMHVADGAFTVGIILSFFRIIYLCQITSYLGLLQLCLGEMVMVILQFAFICIIVLLAFTVGMVFLFNASKIGIKHKQTYAVKHANNTLIYSALTEKFNGFVSTMFTMIYVSLSMEDTETIEDFEDGTLIHLWANLLFIVYFAITMIVILNMLIAMMNNSYMKIADNLTTEHMHSRTTLWMEYIGDEQTRPVPFNLLPSIENLRSLIWYIKKSSCRGSCKKMKTHQRTRLERYAKRKYKELCETLIVRYLRRKYGRSMYDEFSTEKEIDSEDPFVQKVARHFKVWRTIQETSEEQLDNEQQTTSFVESGHTNEFYVSDEEINDSPTAWNDFVQ